MKKKTQLSLIPEIVPPFEEVIEEDPGTPEEAPAVPGELVLSKKQLKLLVIELRKALERDSMPADLWERFATPGLGSRLAHERFQELKPVHEALIDLQQAQGRRNFQVKLTFL